MAKTHVLVQTLNTPTGVWNDSGATTSGDTEISLDGVVNANGGGANAITMNFPATGFQSMGLMATVPCVVTFTGATAINGVSISTVTLIANTLSFVTALVGAVTAVSVGANTDGGGLAGTIKLSIIYNS